jgi:signal peptidase I
VNKATLIRLAWRVSWQIACAVVAALAIFAVLTRAAQLTGRELFAINGGSMEPTIPNGSLVAVQAVDPMRIAIGDIVTVRAGNGMIYSHRVVQVLDGPEGRLLQLRGDANASADEAPVAPAQVVGRVTESVPLAGSAWSLLSTIPGFVAALSVPILLFLIHQLLGSLALKQPAHPVRLEDAGVAGP